jgi:hypothetical protein
MEPFGDRISHPKPNFYNRVHMEGLGLTPQFLTACSGHQSHSAYFATAACGCNQAYFHILCSAANIQFRAGPESDRR